LHVRNRVYLEVLDSYILKENQIYRTDTKTANSTQMSFNWKVELVNVLLECLIMSDRNMRDTVVNDLPDGIKNSIRRNSVDRVDVTNIVARCLDYPNGIETLIKIVRVYEGNSIGMQKVDELIE